LQAELSEITAGSLPDNNIYLPYKGISRYHFAVRNKQTRWELSDLGSTNGTYLNGEKITKDSKLKAGDVILAGVVQVNVETSSKEMEAIALPSEPPGIDRLKTERVSALSLDSKENLFSFPKLILPDGMFLGKSRAMFEIYEKLNAVLESDVNIFFIGETGTGKELLAKTVHLSSSRARAPFIAVNCAAIPADLAEAELFGIGERVATDVSQRKGKIAAAEGGTLFLDELEAFPLPLQAKILRAVEERTVTPVGEHRTIPVDFRLLSATNQEPEELIRAQKLREDLYHRLATVEIHLPPLRERTEDLEVLIPGLFQQFSKKEGKTFAGISRRLLGLLLNYSYPGNVRELVNIVRATVALAHHGELLDVHLLPERLLGGGEAEVNERDLKEKFEAAKVPLRKEVEEFTRRLIVYALRVHNGNIRRAAEQLDVTPFGLRKMMNRLKIEP
jgi:transcriptional regulator with PAS, ATPase and Fis domain